MREREYKDATAGLGKCIRTHAQHRMCHGVDHTKQFFGGLLLTLFPEVLKVSF